MVNTANVATGHIVFNGANADGATGNVIVFTRHLQRVGAGTSALDLAYSAMAAAGTFCESAAAAHALRWSGCGECAQPHRDLQRQRRHRHDEPADRQRPDGPDANTFTRTGYTFSGWNTAANGSGTAYADGATYAFAADVTLYAQWTALPNHTVTFNANGGTGTMSTQTANVPTALTLNTFTRTGYSFSGWNTAANGSGTAYADGATYSFAADITLYAQWTALPNHTVTFNATAARGTMSAQIANVPTALTLNTFTRTGYSFSGWNTAANGSGTAYADGATYSFAADITLYAQWTALPNHTVTFNGNGGTGTMSPQTANVPTALTLNTFTRTGYSFSGWNTAATARAPPTPMVRPTPSRRTSRSTPSGRRCQPHPDVA